MDLFTKKCSKCGTVRGESWFSYDISRNDSRSAWCKPCLRTASRLRRTGLDQDAYDALLASQEGRCGVCCTPFDRNCQPRIDRTATGTVRGLLCGRCKVGVATFREDPTRLGAAIAYLAQ
jgi:Recombination endonuclease VII